jgi:hypothetical protein
LRLEPPFRIFRYNSDLAGSEGKPAIGHFDTPCELACCLTTMDALVSAAFFVKYELSFNPTA